MLPAPLPPLMRDEAHEVRVQHQVVWMDAATRFRWSPQTPGVHVHLWYIWTSLEGLEQAFYSCLHWDMGLRFTMQELDED